MRRKNEAPPAGVANPPPMREIRKRELKRFTEAVENAAKRLKEEKAKSGVPATDPYYEDLGIAQVLTVRAAEEVLRHVPLMRERERGRYKWDVFVSGATMILRKFRQSYLAKVVFPLLRLDRAGEYTQALAGKYVETLSGVNALFQQVQKYAEAYSYAVERTEKTGRMEEGLCAQYADYRTWVQDEEFSDFAGKLEASLSDGIEIIIEDSIKLYLLLMNDRFLIILRAATAGRLSDLFGTKDLDRDLEDALAIPSLLRDIIEQSQMLKVVRELLPAAMKEYAALWKKEHENLRKRCIDKERRIRFVKDFESGVLFRETV